MDDKDKADPQGDVDERNRAAWLLIAAITLSDIAAARAFWGTTSAEHDYGILLGQDGWKWDAKHQIYRNRAGHKLNSQELRGIAVHIAKDGGRRLREMADEMAAGAMPLKEWQIKTAEEVKRIYLTQAALAAGGFDNLKPEIINVATGSVEKPPGINFSINRLYDFAHDVKDGAPRNDTPQSIATRAAAYAEASLSVYEEVKRASHMDAKDEESRPQFLWERNILGQNENHCVDSETEEGCVETTEAGWQPIGTLPAPGLRRCRSNCLCTMEYSLLGPAGK